MSSRKEKELKEFIISARKKLLSGIGSAPIWIFQKANKRIFSRKQKRHWKRCDFGKQYRKRMLKAKRGD